MAGISDLGGGFLIVCTAVGLAAACGLRVFLPLFLAGVAVNVGWLGVHDGFEWLGSTPAIVAFGIASALEVASYHVPLIDHLLDTIAVPAAAIAGAVISLAVLVEVAPWLRWSLAVIAGSGVATALRVPLVGARAAATVTTAGLGNQVLSLGESVAATGLSFVAVLLPLAVIPFLLAFFGGLLWLVLRFRRRSARRETDGEGTWE